MSEAVFDASITTRWFVGDDPLHRQCLAARETYDGVAPGLILIETANALWRYVRLERLSIDAACEAVGYVDDEVAQVDDLDLVRAAQRLGHAADHPVYDCLYVALALRLSAPLITADLKMARKFEAHPALVLRPVSVGLSQ